MESLKRKREPSIKSEDSDIIEISDEESSKPSSSKPACKYGSKCYRKNPDHHKEFSHPVNEEG